MGIKDKDFNANNIPTEEFIKQFIQSHTDEDIMIPHNNGFLLSDIISISESSTDKINEETFGKLFSECFDKDKSE